MSKQSYEVVVFGATSFVGQILARYLLDTFGVDGDLRWAIAGRSSAKLATLKELCAKHGLGLDAAIAVPLNGGERPIELFDRAPFRIFEFEFLRNKPPLNAVASSKVPLFFEKHIHLRSFAGPRIPTMNASLIIDQANMLSTLLVSADPDHAIFAFANHPQRWLVPAEFHNLTAGVETGHALFLIAVTAGC